LLLKQIKQSLRAVALRLKQQNKKYEAAIERLKKRTAVTSGNAVVNIDSTTNDNPNTDRERRNSKLASAPAGAKADAGAEDKAKANRINGSDGADPAPEADETAALRFPIYFLVLHSSLCIYILFLFLNVK
jgi:hypothetical protein